MSGPPSEPLTKTVLARVPYLNCAPFFHGLSLEGSWELENLPPRQFGLEAEAGRIAAGPMSLMDYFRLQDRFERLGNFGIAVRGRSGSALLFSRKPLRQLDGATIAVTQDTSTTVMLLRLLLEVRYELVPQTYQRGTSEDADAVLLIGDEALAFRATTRRYPYETDLSFEWWLWQHLPFVFAVWAVRKDGDPADKQLLSRELLRAFGLNSRRLDVLAAERVSALGRSAEELTEYLEHFVYRFSQPEEDGIRAFSKLVHEHRLL